MDLGLIMNNIKESDKLIIILLDGPYISQYADMGYEIAKSALNLRYNVKIFLYMDGVHLPRKEQNPMACPDVADNITKLIDKGCEVKACIRCAAARGYSDETDYVAGVKITSVYDLGEWMDREDTKVITLGR